MEIQSCSSVEILDWLVGEYEKNVIKTAEFLIEGISPACNWFLK
jgi:hypothetical protein